VGAFGGALVARSDGLGAFGSDAVAVKPLERRQLLTASAVTVQAQ